jgi:hypothetical protein
MQVATWWQSNVGVQVKSNLFSLTVLVAAAPLIFQLGFNKGGVLP